MNPRYDKVAIFCETPFQLIVCLNTAVGYLHAKECVVFPVQDMYKSSSRFLVPPQPPLIRHVYPVRRTQASQTSWQGHWNHLRYGKNYTLLDFMYKFPRDMSFDAAVGIRYTARCRQILQAFDKKMPYYMVEEGIGEYSWPRRDGELCADTLASCPMFTSLTHVCLLPDLYRTMYPGETVVQAPTIGPDSPLRPVVRRQLWPGENFRMPALPKVLYFHQPLDGRFDNTDDDRRLREREDAVLALLRQASPGRVQLKLHPREPEDAYPAEELLQLPAAWELVPCMQSIEEMLLVSENSTALISPKLLFDQEPMVMVLEALFPQNPATEGAHQARLRLMETVRGTYRDPRRFCIPRTMEELEENLARLMAL